MLQRMDRTEYSRLALAVKNNKQGPDLSAMLALVEDMIIAETLTMVKEVDNAEMWRRQGRVQSLTMVADLIRQPAVTLDKKPQ